MRVNSRLMAVAAAWVLLTAAPARAEWFVTPFIGGNFGGATDQPLFGKTDAITKPWTFSSTTVELRKTRLRSGPSCPPTS